MPLPIKKRDESIKIFQHERNHFERLIDRTLAKLSSVITLSGLLTFIALALASEELIRQYLIWVFPYLFIGIVVWIFIFKHSSSSFLIYHPLINGKRTIDPIKYLHAEYMAEKESFEMASKSYRKTRKLFGLSLAFIVAYLLNYTIYFYLLAFTDQVSILESILIFEFSIGFLYIFIRWYNRTQYTHSRPDGNHKLASPPGLKSKKK